MDKWYLDKSIDESIIISSRVRLARNIRKYPFCIMQSEETAGGVVKDTVEAVKRGGESFNESFDYIDLNEKSDIEKLALINRHVISPEFVKGRGPRGVLLEKNEEISIMLNEEDHIRMQAIYPGDNMDNAWEMVDKIDNLIEENVEYAFDKEFGYLTSCPTNTGTGLRASYMIHVPLLESTGQFSNIAATIGKFGMTVRGIYGEGTEPMGSIYQISNQITLGKSEEEIMKSLKAVTAQIIEKEQSIREYVVKQNSVEVADKIYRAYGVLTNCRRISLKEAITLLSQVRLGMMTGLLEIPSPRINIYAIMMNIQPGQMQYRHGKTLSENEGAVLRAEYIRKNIN